MAVAWEGNIGSTAIRIHDDYCRDVPKEEVERILKRIAARAQEEFTAAALKEKETEPEKIAV